MAISFLAVQELNERYNNDPRSFTDEEAEMIAGLSKQFGLDFQRTSRPLAKGAFDFADIASFGLLPNEWRPASRGDLAYGESSLDKFAGGVGSVGGLLGAAGAAKGLYQGGKAAYGALRGGGGATAAGGGGGATAAGGGAGAAVEGEIVRKSAEGITKTGRGLLPPYEGAGALVPDPLRLTGRLGLPSRPTPLQLTSGSSIKKSGDGRFLPSDKSSDISMEMRRLRDAADAGDYSAFESLVDLERQYLSPYATKVDYRRRFGFRGRDDLDNPFPF